MVTASCAEEGLTRGQPAEIVAAHNAWRAKVGVRSIHWSAELASLAQRRAGRLAGAGCAVEHGLLPADIGENLFRALPLRAEGRPDEVNPVTPSFVVDAWASESLDYDPVAHRCARGKQCGHYTQIAWAATREVGCGMAVCRNKGQVWVCNYRPPGNVEGRRPF
jgi:pathogenesis-related protein 1